MTARLGTLLGVTILCPELDAVVAAYGEALGYQPCGSEPLGSARGQAWEAPAARDLHTAALQPEAGGPRFVRFIETEDALPAPAPHRASGWNAVELVVRDLDHLADRLDRRSDFQIIGPPAVLEFDFTDRIRAMQVIGPAGELLYFTAIAGEVPGFDLPAARCAVDAPFVGVLGTRDIAASMAWYAALADRAAASFEAPVSVISHAHGLPPMHRHTLATVALPDATLVEIDALPEQTTGGRRLAACGLPTGIVTASFVSPSGRTDTLRGPDGELIELVAPPA